MKRSILQLLKSKGHKTRHYKDDDLIIKEIDKLLENNENLSVEICYSWQVWVRKRGNFKYNMKLQILDGFRIKSEFNVYMGRDCSFYFIAEMMEKILSGQIINDECLESHINDDFDDWVKEDPFSEKSIMRDLERGEGYKHGLD